MRFNIKKIAAIGTSILLTGMTMGLAAAAMPYPQPFIQNGVANVAVVYGTGSGVSPLDIVQAGNIQSSLQSFLGSTSTSGTGVTTSGQVVPIFNPSTNIWLNTSLTNAQSTYTSSALPQLLAATTFSGNVQSTVTPIITLNGNGMTGALYNNSVIFAKMPTANTDPVVGVSLGTQPSSAIYNATVTFSPAVNFTDPNSIGSIITLFGQPYVVSSTTSTANGLVLYSSAQTLNLVAGAIGNVTINGAPHSISLVSASSTIAQVTVDGASATINSGSSKIINGINVAVTSVIAGSGPTASSASVLVGTNQITLQNSQQVMIGIGNSVIQGTMVYFNGGNVTNLGQLTVAIAAPNINNATILKGTSFVDPVFGNFQITNAGLNYGTNSAARDNISINANGASTLQIAMTNMYNQSAAFDFVSNPSGTSVVNLTTSNNYPLYPYEDANLSLVTGGAETIVGGVAGTYGHLLQLTNVVNSTGTANDFVYFNDLFTGKQLQTNAATAEGVTSLTLDGNQYTVYYGNIQGSGWAQIKYPTSISAATTGTGYGTFTLYPTIQGKDDQDVAVYTPLNLSLGNTTGATINVSFDGNGTGVGGFNLPNGNGYTNIPVVYTGGSVNGTAAYAAWTINGVLFNTSNGTAVNAGNTTQVTVGRLTYNFTNGNSSAVGGYNLNRTIVYLVQPGSTAYVNTTAVEVFEPKDFTPNYNAIVIPVNITSTSGSTNYLGVQTPLFTSPSLFGPLTMFSNTNKQQWMDWMGSLVTKDSTNSNQPVLGLSIPPFQVFEQLYLGATNAIVNSGSGGTTTATQLGNILVKDTQVSSVYNNNLIIVGGSCINAAAATLLGVAQGTCASGFTSATVGGAGSNDNGVGTGQFLVQSFNNSINGPGLVSVLVAGYDAPDTVNAATYLTTQMPDLTIGKKYIGTTSTTASLQVS